MELNEAQFLLDFENGHFSSTVHIPQAYCSFPKLQECRIMSKSSFAAITIESNFIVDIYIYTILDVCDITSAATAQRIIVHGV